MECTIEFRVRYAETDQMKFAHHAAYIVWFEMARIELLRKIDLSYAQMERDGLLLPVLEVNARFYKPAFFDELLQIRARFNEIVKARLRIDYQVYRDEQRICEGYSVHAFMNCGGRPVRPPQFFLEKFRK
ncbi:acyl-CoA thioesterase [Calditrichota bacterium LG25]